MDMSLKSLSLTKIYKRVLVISDQHHPFQHKDLIPFLSALKKKYKFDLIVNIGDEVDKAAMSYHEKDPDMPGAKDELERAIKEMQPLYKLFPKMYVIDSNHGSLVRRKGKSAGLPSSVFKTPREILRAPKNWTWCGDLQFTTPLGAVKAIHGITATAGKYSQNQSKSTVQGHFHSKFQIDYWGNGDGLYWDMHVACLVDDTSLAMAYNKLTLKRPVIGVGVIIEGKAILEPMVLNSKGRWIGKL